MALLENTDPSGITPVDYYVLVELEKTENISKGGIVIPDRQVEKQQWGETRAKIIKLGPKCFADHPAQELDGEVRHLRPGDHVWISQQTVYRLIGKDEKYHVLITDKDILAYISSNQVDKN